MATKDVVIRAAEVVKTYRKKVPPEGIAGMLSHLVRPKYEAVAALNGVSFDVPRATCLGFLGPNGAGKSTLLKIFCGLQTPTSGEVEILGGAPEKGGSHYLRRIGVVLGHKSSLWWDLPVSESFEAARVLYDVPRARFLELKEKLVRSLSLERVLGAQVRTLSLGERVKCELATVLLHDPEVLFLDEPTIGLDIGAKSELRKVLNHLVRQEGKTVFLTSHDMKDVDSCCDRVILINRGSLEYDGPVARLCDELTVEEKIRIQPSSTKFSDAELAPLHAIAARHPDVRVETLEESVSLSYPKGLQQIVLQAVLSAKLEATLELTRPSLEELLVGRFQKWRARP